TAAGRVLGDVGRHRRSRPDAAGRRVLLPRGDGPTDADEPRGATRVAATRRGGVAYSDAFLARPRPNRRPARSSSLRGRARSRCGRGRIPKRYRRTDAGRWRDRAALDAMDHELVEHMRAE